MLYFIEYSKISFGDRLVEAKMSDLLEINIFGGLNIKLNGSPLNNFMSNKVPALLVYLAVMRRSQPRDTLTALLWGDMSELDARNNLRQALSNLRKNLEPFIWITREAVALKSESNCRVDVFEFEQLVKADPGTDASTEMRSLLKAAVLYKGRFLEGFNLRDAPEFENWLFSQQAIWHEYALQALDKLTTHFIKRAEYGMAIEYANRLLLLDAWREEAHRQLMVALVHSGQRTAALAQYKTCSRVLHKELGIEPSSETKALHTRILALGNQPPHNLPQQPTAFIDRSEELSKINQCLSQSDCRLHNLVGAGGMGKTRLALQAAECAWRRGQFLDGVFHVPLARVNSISQLTALVAQAVNLKFAGSQQPFEQLLNHLRNKEMLLLLDNFDHLVTDESTLWLDKVLQNAPAVTFLLTSRTKLNSRWEKNLQVEGMPYPQSGEWLNPMEYSSVKLFLDRARTVGVEIPLTWENRTFIGRICANLMGMPLGIELAAAHTGEYSCEEISTIIAQNLDFLTSNFRDMPQRHRSLRAVFDASWQLLTPGDQQTFAALSVFQGSFSLQAAQAVAGASRFLLAGLVEKSLLIKIDQERFQLHNMLRMFASQQLDGESRARIEMSHAQYYADWLHRQDLPLYSSQQEKLLSEIARDHENFRSSWNWIVENKKWRLLILEVVTLRNYYNIKSRFLDGIEWLEPARKALTESIDDEGAGEALAMVQSRLASFYAWAGKRDNAELAFKEALSLVDRFAKPDEMGFLLLNMGYHTAMTSANYELAEQQFSNSQKHYQRALNNHGAGNALSALGALFNITGKWDQSKTCLERSVEIFRAIEDAHGLCSALTNLGNVHYLTGNLAEAKRYYNEVVPLCRMIGDLSAEGIVLANLGAIASETQDLDTAEQLLQQGLQRFRETNSPQSIIQATTMLCSVYRMTHQYQPAKEALLQALDVTLEQGLDRLLPHIIFELAQLYRDVGKFQPGLALFYWVCSAPATEAEHRRDSQKVIEQLQETLSHSEILAAQDYARHLNIRKVQSELADWIVTDSSPVLQ